jgi:hypothetical protein
MRFVFWPSLIALMGSMALATPAASQVESYQWKLESHRMNQERMDNFRKSEEFRRAARGNRPHTGPARDMADVRDRTINTMVNCFFGGCAGRPARAKRTRSQPRSVGHVSQPRSSRPQLSSAPVGQALPVAAQRRPQGPARVLPRYVEDGDPPPGAVRPAVLY